MLGHMQMSAHLLNLTARYTLHNCFVVMDTMDYKNKCQAMLSDKKTYEKLPSDPTTKYQAKLRKILKRLKDNNEINQNVYQSLRPSGNYSTPPKFYGSPKIHKKEIPMRGIVSSIGSVAYKTAKHIADILKALFGYNGHHVGSTKEFIERLGARIINGSESNVSYDIRALFACIPKDKAVQVTGRRLEEDKNLSDRTNLSISSILELLEFCLDNTYFMFDGEFYIQTFGCAMGSPVSPIIANIYMEYFEVQAITTTPTPPKYWDRYVDDTWAVVLKAKIPSDINDWESPCDITGNQYS